MDTLIRSQTKSEVSPIVLETPSKIEVTEENFEQYFFDARRHKPKKGQILAKFTAVAEFIHGRGKLDIMDLVKKDKAHQAVQVMKKIHGAKEPDCFKVVREIAEDLLRLPANEVEYKPYRYIVEYLFYTQKELVPKNKHWETINLIEYNKDTNEYHARIEV